MKNIITLLMLMPIYFNVDGAEKFFYDNDNSCSLGCACAWDVTQPEGAIQLGKDTPDNPGQDEIIFSKCILVNPGSVISFKINNLDKAINFCGFSIDSGSYDGNQNCTLPKKFVVIVNGNDVSHGELKNCRDRQKIVTESVNIKNGDIISLKIVSGNIPNKMIGITYLTLNGGH